MSDWRFSGREEARNGTVVAFITTMPIGDATSRPGAAASRAPRSSTTVTSTGRGAVVGPAVRDRR